MTPILSRRQFVWAFAGSSASLVLGTKSGAQTRHRTGLPGDAGSQLPMTRRRVRALGTTVELTVRHSDRDVAERAIAAAFEELDRVEDVMSLYRPNSQLCRLNRTGRLCRPDSRLVDVLTMAARVSQKSRGAFDVTIQPLWELFWRAKQEQTVPSVKSIQAVVKQVDFRRVDVDRAQIRLRGRATRLTLNGIAQGYALDRVAATLQSHGIHHALIDTGEIGARGDSGTHAGWSVGIQHPRVADAYVALVRLDGRCLATSGDYATAFTDDFALHHLLDPRTGRSPTELASVSVLAPSGVLADALSTAAFVLGASQGSQLVTSFHSCDALFVRKDNRVFRTAGFPLERLS